jgi:predicted AlkP superfamily pyrophosphatase or phosphodiesterase
MSRERRVIFVCCDGLGRAWVSAERTPVLHALTGAALWCAEHRAVFPSVTRVSAASIATGCRPRRHGLHGNRMGLVEDGRIVVRDVGKPDFRDHMRRATGTTLCVPTLAERVAAAGGFIAFSNVSPGAAYFLDPEHFGHVYHRAGSYAPGGSPIEGGDALAVSHDLEGDAAMTRRFCAEIIAERQPAVGFLWLANPDLTLHGAPLGSPRHLEALAHADRCVGAVEERRARGEEILLLVGSDHGQETIGASVEIEAWLAAHGLGRDVASGDVAVAAQGTAALLYAMPRARDALLGVLGPMRAEEWAGEIVAGEALAALGLAEEGGLVAAVDMARRDEPNAHGVPGQRWTAAEPGKTAPVGCGQHGGWGPDETRPFLILDGPGIAPGSRSSPTTLVDIAPTILAWLGLPHSGLDGAKLIGAES